LNLEIVGNVYYEQSDSHYLDIKGGSNLIEMLTVTNSEGKLSIELKDKNNLSGNKNNLEFRIGSPHLEKISLNSVGVFISDNEFKGDKLSIINNGVGNIKIRNCNVRDFNLISNGVGTITITGNTIRTFINSQGVGEIDCSHFKSEKTIVECRGIGNASVYAKDNIDIKLSGIGSVKYYGNPEEVKSNISGLGKIENMES